MRITINLATRPFADVGPAIKRLRILMGVMALISVGMGLGLYLLHNKAEQARAHAHSLDGKIAAINQERQSYENMMHEPENARLLVESAALNQLFDEKTFSWTLAMEDLETVLPGGVQVSTLEPVREKDGRITLRLRVIGPRDRSIQLVENLEHSKRFTLPRIVGENAETTGAPGEKLEPVSASNRVNFDLLAQYNPATIEDFKQAAKPDKAAAPKTDTTKTPAPAAAHPVAAVKPVAGQAPPGSAKPRPRPGQAMPPVLPGHSPYAGISRPPPARQQPKQPLPNPGGPK
jgi:type IV pilus assembly protein PilN